MIVCYRRGVDRIADSQSGFPAAYSGTQICRRPIAIRVRTASTATTRERIASSPNPSSVKTGLGRRAFMTKVASVKAAKGKE